ncbi:unnamed protein product [Phaeothamnion confervicola]
MRSMKHRQQSIPIVLCIVLASAAAQPGVNLPAGWSMEERFHGFRYEVHGDFDSDSYCEAAAAVAEELGCFGWIQHTSRGTLVGEARCRKENGPKVLDWLRRGPAQTAVGRVEVKDYEDTKIRLHFSHFRVLEDERRTCFRDPPHQCLEFIGGAVTAPVDGSAAASAAGAAEVTAPAAEATGEAATSAVGDVAGAHAALGGRSEL